MSQPKSIAEAGWLSFVIDHLQPALKAAETTASDLAKLRICDVAGCGRLFDGSDPRASSFRDGRSDLHICPACVMEAKRGDRVESPPLAGKPPEGFGKNGTA